MTDPAEQPNFRTAEPPNAPAFIPATVVAELLGIHRVNVQRRCLAEDWEHRYTGGENGGRRLEIALAALPPDVQIRALARMNVGGSGSEVQRPEGPKAGTEYERASVTERAEADRRLGLLTAWREFIAIAETSRQRTRYTLKFIRLSREQGQRVSKASLYAWAAAYRARGLDGLLPAYRGGRPAGLSGEDKALFLSLWSGDRDYKVAPAYRSFLIVRAHQGLPGPAPTLQAIRYMLSRLTEQERDLLRKGKAAYEQAHLPFLERDYQVDPLEWLCLDDRQFDVITISRLTGKLHRPYVCAGEDLGTRRGVVTVVDHPCQDGTLATVGKAMATWGVPRNLYVDNGKNYKAKSVTGTWSKGRPRGLNENQCRSLCDQAGIVPHFAIKQRARSKPVERLFATIAENLDKILPAYCGRSTEHKPEELKADLDAGRIITDDEFERVLTGWLEAEYHQNMPHHGEGMNGRTPNQAWAEKIGQATVRTATREQLAFWGMRAPKVRGRWPVVRNGRVVLLGRRYHAALENPDCLHGQDGREVIGRIFPWDVRYAFLTDLEDRPIGWCVEKGLLGFGEVEGRRVDEARARQRRANALRRAHREELTAARAEPDMLKRVVREHYARQAQTDERGRPVPTPPPGKPRVVEMIPMPPGAKESARLVAQGPPSADARQVGREAVAQDQEALDLILGDGARPRAAILAPPAGKSEYDEALDLILEAKA